MVELPFSDLASFNQELILDGIPYRIKFDYNIRFGFWTMSVSNRDLVPIVSGIKLVLGYNLFDQYPGLDLPNGELYVVDTTEDVEKINRENIIDPLVIIYVEEDELATV